MRISITHDTSYAYDEPVPFALQELRLTPRPSEGQHVLRWEMAIEGGRKEVEFADHHANQVQLISIVPDRQHLTVHCEGEVETTDTGGVTTRSSGFAPRWLFLRGTTLTEPGAAVDELLAGIDDPTTGNLIEGMHDLSRHVAAAVSYELGHTDDTSTAEEVLVAGRGVCQDHAHVFITAARRLGVPARYVSGYLVMDGRVDQDATHAWAEVWIDDLGWVGFDVSNGICPDDRYVRVAVGLDYKEAAPVVGVRFGDASEHMHVALQVQQ